MVSEACEGDDNRSVDGDLVSVIQGSREVRGERLRGGVVPSLSEPLSCRRLGRATHREYGSKCLNLANLT